MAIKRKRRSVSRDEVRKAWQGRIAEAAGVGFCDTLLENIADDSPEIRMCWCCGSQGYQEVAHIVPFSLGGRCRPSNMFLLCAECHMASPDYADPKYFIQHVNSDAGKWSRASIKLMNDALERVEAAMKRDPERMLKMLEGGRFPAALKDSFARAGQHGASVSRSTKAAILESTIDDICSNAT